MGAPDLQKVVLYNGASGGLGRYLGEALVRERHRAVIIESMLEDAPGLARELERLTLKPGTPVAWVQMAAMVSVPECEKSPEQARKINVTDTVRSVRDFVAWARAKGLLPEVFYVSTGHVYASQPMGVRIDERAPTAPRSVYARTKLEAEDALREELGRSGVRLQIGRVFGLVSPAQPPNYVLPGLIRRVREERLSDVPGYSYFRDYLDSRDVCAAIARLLGTGGPEDVLVNICSGEPVTIQGLLELAIEEAHPADPERVRSLKQRATGAPGRPDDVPWIVGDPSAARALIGQPLQSIPLRQTVRETLESSLASLT